MEPAAVAWCWALQGFAGGSSRGSKGSAAPTPPDCLQLRIMRGPGPGPGFVAGGQGREPTASSRAHEVAIAWDPQGFCARVMARVDCEVRITLTSAQTHPLPLCATRVRPGLAVTGVDGKDSGGSMDLTVPISLHNSLLTTGPF